MSNEVLSTLQSLKSHFLLQLSEMPEYRAMKALEKTIAEVTEILNSAQQMEPEPQPIPQPQPQQYRRPVQQEREQMDMRRPHGLSDRAAHPHDADDPPLLSRQAIRRVRNRRSRSSATRPGMKQDAPQGRPAVRSSMPRWG